MSQSNLLQWISDKDFMALNIVVKSLNALEVPSNLLHEHKLVLHSSHSETQSVVLIQKRNKVLS